MIKLFKKISDKKKEPYIKERSNIIQYDTMGYPLRLCITKDHDQQWIDTYEEDGDLVLKWKETKQND